MKLGKALKYMTPKAKVRCDFTRNTCAIYIMFPFMLKYMREKREKPGVVVHAFQAR